jgi:putative hydrolase of the HAD superfamily
MKKIFIFDADEVILNREMYFSQRLARDFGISEDEIMKFFKNEYQDCAVGKADLKKELEKYIKIWEWKGSVEDLMKYWFENERDINNTVESEIKKLRGEGFFCCLATNNEKYRTQYLLEEVGLKDLFDYVFSSSEIGFLKSQDNFWRHVQEKLGINDLGEIMFWDSDKRNVDKVNELGMKGFLFTNEKEFKEKIGEISNREEANFGERKLA